MQTSNEASLHNEREMSNIKKRLKDAFDNITFYANTTWTSDDYAYQKANQELYSKIIKLQQTFAEDMARPRTVRDCIPQSRLAQYSNYEYNEARELSYTPSDGNVVIHYPCCEKKEEITEPWMLPEVEQLFIQLTYSEDFNLLRYKDLVEFEPVDRSRQTCTPKDFHKVDPRFYETLEKTPGKPRFTNSSCTTDADLRRSVPPLLNFNSFEDFTVKMKIDSDAIRKIWKTSGAEDVKHPKRLQVYKSPFENLFVIDDSKSAKYPECLISSDVPYQFNQSQERAEDLRNLQNLVKLLSKLKEGKAARARRPCARNSKPEKDAKDDTPTKRLYSDVVQGLVSNKNSSSKVQDAGPSTSLEQSDSPENLADSDETCSYKLSPIVKNPPPTPPASWTEKPEKKTTDYAFTSQAKNAVAGVKSIGSNRSEVSSPPMHSCGGGSAISSEHHPNDVYLNPNVYGGNFHPCQYSQSSTYCSNFTSTNFSYAPYGNHLPRTFAQHKQNTFHHSSSGQQWMLHHYRAPSVYNVSHFPPQPYFFLPPQPARQHRWIQPPHYARPYHVGINPPHTPPVNWGVQNQNLYRTNSTQHVCSPPHHHHQVFENSSSVDLRQKYKNRSQMNLAWTRNKSRENLLAPEYVNKFQTQAVHKKPPCDVTSGKTLAKPVCSAESFHLKHVVVRSKEELLVERESLPSTVSKEFQCVAASMSDELERQAMDEYQSSNESFYKELEREAEEQYENSENSLGPPNDKCFGGPGSVAVHLMFVL